MTCLSFIKYINHSKNIFGFHFALLVLLISSFFSKIAFVFKFSTTQTPKISLVSLIVCFSCYFPILSRSYAHLGTFFLPTKSLLFFGYFFGLLSNYLAENLSVGNIEPALLVFYAEIPLAHKPPNKGLFSSSSA